MFENIFLFLSFLRVSIENPIKVIAGLISTSQQYPDKTQVRLGIESIIHPNQQVTIVLIRVSASCLS